MDTIRALRAGALLEKCRAQFKFYEQNHMAKQTTESLEKAKVNAKTAKEIEDFLRNG